MKAIVWFRKDLRIRDNVALHKAATSKKLESLLPVYFIHEPRTLCGANRWQFLIDSLEDLDCQLKALGSRLLIIRGDARTELPKLISQLGVDSLYFEDSHEPNGRLRDDDVISRLGSDVAVSSTPGRLLFDHSTLKDTHTYKGFTSQLSGMKIPKSLPDLETLPPLPDHDLSSLGYQPVLQDFCRDKPTSDIRGGTKEAYRRLEEYCKDFDRVAVFEKPQTSPAALKSPSTTLLSPYISWGCISIRHIHEAVESCIKKSKKRASQPPVSLIGQLYWREFYYFQAKIIKNFDVMLGNSICRQMPWRPAIKSDDEGYENFQKWKNGETGFPWIDALMIQLRETGWMHHLARHSVACFLTRGDLYVHWERGKEHFQEMLVDHDWSLNAGNWMWLSASAYFSQFFRVYSPVAFPKKYDKSGEFVKHFIPALKRLPPKFVYEPWLMTKAEQKLYSCVLGKDYPHPIVDHASAKDECLEKMVAAYKATNKKPEKRAREDE